MAKYRKKPVVIDAVEFTGDQINADGILGWAWHENECEITCHRNGSNKVSHLTIPTLEGHMIANPGDYIIRGIKGEFYPCKPDIFAATYEAAD